MEALGHLSILVAAAIVIVAESVADGVFRMSTEVELKSNDGEQAVKGWLLVNMAKKNLNCIHW